MGPVGLHHHHAQVGVGGGGMPGLAGLAMPPSAMDPLHSAVGFPPGMDRPCKYDSIFTRIYIHLQLAVFRSSFDIILLIIVSIICQRRE